MNSSWFDLPPSLTTKPTINISIGSSHVPYYNQKSLQDVSSGQHTFQCGPATGADALPTFSKQVTADMPLYNVTVGAKKPPFFSASHTYASKISESISVKDGATGNGDTPDTIIIQEAIDYAIRNGIATVHFPNGRYVMTQYA